MSFLLIKIGQNDENDVVLTDPSIAPEHAEIFVDVEGNVFLTDLGTGKDTFVNGHKLRDSIELKSMDKVTFGDGIELDWKTVLEINQPKTITVGKANSNDFVIDAPSVSENHLQLIQDQNDSYFINDLDSEQGTYVNGNRISEIALLKAGDVVHVGDELFLWKSLFSNSETPSESDIIVDFEEITNLEKEVVVEEVTELPLEQLEISFESVIEELPEEEIQELIEIEVKSQVESEDEKEYEKDSFVETPELKESFVVKPDPIDFVVEPEVMVTTEPEKSEPVFEKPTSDVPVIERAIREEIKVETPTDLSELELDKTKEITRKKEMIQLAVIVAADILLMILISAWI